MIRLGIIYMFHMKMLFIAYYKLTLTVKLLLEYGRHINFLVNSTELKNCGLQKSIS